jgi:hypothetical protein
VLAENVIRAGHAACRHSWGMLPSRCCRRMSMRAICIGSAIGEGNRREGIGLIGGSCPQGREPPRCPRGELHTSPKMDGGWAGGSSRRCAAEPGSGGVSGCWLEGDSVAQGLELSDVVTGFAFGVDAGVVEAGAEVVEGGVGVGE